jgi:ATP-dependent exoDNAse (exonuclease V) beta subunit
VTDSLPAPDAIERARALDPERSFLVQAPAGAGKTELLVRRYLRLLATATEPEEILAVTFTRKAAAEMQRRILTALAADGTATDGGAAGAAAEMGQLVAAVRARDGARGWQLPHHPSRLRISTIDALNAALARSAPVSAGASALRPVAQNPDRLYRLAARATLRLLAEADGPSIAVADLLRHLDNDPGRAEELLAQLLARRDQWLPFVGAGLDPVAARRNLESSLGRLVERELQRVEVGIEAERRAEIAEVVHAAAINRGVDLGSGTVAGRTLAERGAWWRFTAATFLTRDGEWRKKLDKNGGFPPDQKDLKAHALALLAALRATEGLLEAFAAVKTLPAPHYSAVQWSALESLLTLLPFAAAELKLVLAAEGATDYAEIAAEGRAALGDGAAPSELALRVDWRLQHLLLDEFQDTSQAQYALLRALTRGWTPGDGRTLFLVGDPMQSIYRFRQAEVRLFLDVRDHGLPGVVLEFLRLRANFRSVPALVTWANSTFEAVFPKVDDLVSSAISLAPSEPARTGPLVDPAAVTFHSSGWHEQGAEADEVVRVVRDTLVRWPAGSVGILVRSRSQAAHAVAALRAAKIDLAANDLVELGRTALANDLLAITRALVHTGDRLAWLTVLRAPWCGLSLADLEHLGAVQDGRTLYELVRDAAVLAGLTVDGQARVARVTEVFGSGLARLGQIPLRDVVDGVWLELGGPAVAGTELALADLILDEINRHDVGGDCADVLELTRALDRTRASLPGAGAPVQVMTIHKAKGLQFDTVIVPGLGRGIRREERPALLWQELAQAGTLDLLLAPVNASGAADDPLYELLWALRAQQELAETDRLLYVAVTRARERLHLFGQAPPALGRPDHSPVPRPARGSLLDRLWPVVGATWPGAVSMPQAEPSADPTIRWRQPLLRRLPTGWRRPPPPPSMPMPAGDGPTVRNLVAYDWASAWARQAGSVAHRWLQQIASDGVGQYTEAKLGTLRPRFRQLLLRQGVEAAALDRAVERVVAVLRDALRDAQGRWVLSADHTERLNEYAVTVAGGNRFRRLIIDRAFVAADGVRWIIDYKTSSHEGGDRAAFIRSEVERYAPQLHAYRQAFACLERRTLRTALYFPLLQLLQTVESDDVASEGGRPD